MRIDNQVDRGICSESQVLGADVPDELQLQSNLVAIAAVEAENITLGAQLSLTVTE